MTAECEIYKKPTEEQRHERAKRKGSFFKCLERNCLCECIDNAAEVCRRKHEGKCCILDDPEYVAHIKKVEHNLKLAFEREKQEREREKHDPPVPIRRQRKSAADMLREQIERKERFARTLYRENKPRRADAVMHEVMTLQAKLRKLDEKGCKYL